MDIYVLSNFERKLYIKHAWSFSLRIVNKIIVSLYLSSKSLRAWPLYRVFSHLTRCGNEYNLLGNVLSPSGQAKRMLRVNYYYFKTFQTNLNMWKSLKIMLNKSQNYLQKSALNEVQDQPAGSLFLLFLFIQGVRLYWY